MVGIFNNLRTFMMYMLIVNNKMPGKYIENCCPLFDFELWACFPASITCLVLNMRTFLHVHITYACLFTFQEISVIFILEYQGISVVLKSNFLLVYTQVERDYPRNNDGFWLRCYLFQSKNTEPQDQGDASHGSKHIPGMLSLLTSCFVLVLALL